MHFEELFSRCWAEARPLLRTTRNRGLLLVAVDGHNGHVSFATTSGSPLLPTAAIVGRHPRCDLVLPSRSPASLRHLVVLARSSAAPGNDPRAQTRVVDLRTAQGFLDQRGTHQDSIEAVGPLALSIGHHALFVFATGEDRVWPIDGGSAWQLLAGGQHAASQIARPGGVFGHLVVTASAGDRTEQQVIAVDADAAAAGILVGRYERCDLGPAVRGDNGISRVHLLVITIDGELYAIDTASTHSTYLASPVRRRSPQRVTRLDPGIQLQLGERGSRLTWEPAATMRSWGAGRT